MENKNFDYGFLIKFKKGTIPKFRKELREDLEDYSIISSISKVIFDPENEEIISEGEEEEEEKEKVRFDKPSTWKQKLSPKSFSKIPDKVFDIAILQLLSEKMGIKQSEIISRAEELYRHNPKPLEEDEEDEEDED